MIPIANFEIHARRFLEQELCKFPVLFCNVDRGKRERERGRGKKNRGEVFVKGQGSLVLSGTVLGLSVWGWCVFALASFYPAGEGSRKEWCEWSIHAG
jgi:hypothetical protein